MVEFWKDIDLSGFYQVSNLGRVRSFNNGKWGKAKTPKLLKPYENNKGYLRVRLCISGNQEQHYVHRLVALAFLYKHPKRNCVNHKDLNHRNNKASNLEWVTYKENKKHAIENDAVAFGENHGRSKLTAKDVKNIKDTINNRGYFYNADEIAKKYNVSIQTIKNIASGKSWCKKEKA